MPAIQEKSPICRKLDGPKAKAGIHCICHLTVNKELASQGVELWIINVPFYDFIILF
ncbi:hypothetical protein D3C71_2072370 [compost metagenome]